MLDAHQITELHDQATLRWHQEEASPGPSAFASEPFLETALAHHRANFDLWHEEDKAREPNASDSRIATVKRNIDQLNQTRNDLVEVLDRTLLEAAGKQNPTAPAKRHSAPPRPKPITTRISTA